MSRLLEFCAAGLLGLLLVAPAWAEQPWDDLGRTATETEVAAWDIDVRPDFRGLPPGSGTVDDGMDLFESTCAACHGIFGESNAVFTPLIGGTTAEDMETGHVANLAREDYPGTTTIMKVPTVSTLWDYISRAMPWDHPKSLEPDEVYAVTAFLLNLADIVPDDFELSHGNMAEVQARMPNRLGMTTEHAMWPGDEFGAGNKVAPDVQNTACMKDCGGEPEIISELPEYARDMWGNLREQNRTVGPQRGADTTQPEGKLGDAAGPVNIVGPGGGEGGGVDAAIMDLLQDSGCMACHNVDSALVGPSFHDIADKYADDAEYIVDSIRSGSSDVWGEAIMPPQNLDDEALQLISGWLAGGAGR